MSLVYRHRTIPLAWMWVPRSRGRSSALRQLALLHYVYGLLPVGAQVLLVGDQEFEAICQFADVNAPPLFGKDAPVIFGNDAPPAGWNSVSNFSES